jgi:hypothetical protein
MKRFGLLVLLALGAVPLAVAGSPLPWNPGGFPPRIDVGPAPEQLAGYLLLEAKGPGSARVLINGAFAGLLRAGATSFAVQEGWLIELDGRASRGPLEVSWRLTSPLRLLPHQDPPLRPSGHQLLAGWVRGPGWPD